MSYGHGVSVTLLQIANAYQIFARNGDMLPLSLVKQETPPTQGRQIISPRTAQELRGVLETVVKQGGTAVAAQVSGYRVGGKTGTSYKLEGGKYTQKYVASFVGIAPLSRPRFIVAVMVDEPSSEKHSGGDVAAPIFARIMSGALLAYGVAPDATAK
jgi:cell division protein FtsI (penicillin-binding protein 3)